MKEKYVELILQRYQKQQREERNKELRARLARPVSREELFRRLREAGTQKQEQFV